jgi:hypothetical protein
MSGKLPMSASSPDVVTEYKKLLKIGRDMLRDPTTDSWSYSLEEHTLRNRATMKQLIKLNGYVATDYSTNEADKTYSVEFAILADYFNATVESLRSAGYFFIAKNYKTEEYVENISNDVSKGYLLDIDGRDSLDYNNPNENRFSDDFEPYISTFKHDINIELLSHNLAVFMVEDPAFGRTDLYKKLTEILKPIVSPILKPSSTSSRRVSKRIRIKTMSAPIFKSNSKTLRKSRTIKSIGGTFTKQ